MLPVIHFNETIRQSYWSSYRARHAILPCQQWQCTVVTVFNIRYYFVLDVPCVYWLRPTISTTKQQLSIKKHEWSLSQTPLVWPCFPSISCFGPRITVPAAAAAAAAASSLTPDMIPSLPQRLVFWNVEQPTCFRVTNRFFNQEIDFHESQPQDTALVRVCV